MLTVEGASKRTDAQERQIQIAFTIGIAEPISIYSGFFRYRRISDAMITKLLRKQSNFQTCNLNYYYK